MSKKSKREKTASPRIERTETKGELSSADMKKVSGGSKSSMPSSTSKSSSISKKKC